MAEPNPFDRFDELPEETSTNPFNQFDAPVGQEEEEQGFLGRTADTLGNARTAITDELFGDSSDPLMGGTEYDSVFVAPERSAMSRTQGDI